MRIGPGATRVYERRAPSRTGVCDGFRHRFEGGDEIRSVTFTDVEVGHRPKDCGNTATRRLMFNRNGYGETVILDDNDQGQTVEAGRIYAFPKLAFACGAIARTHHSHFIAIRVHVAAGVRATHGLDK